MQGVNASIGTSSDICNISLKVEKARAAQEQGADTLMAEIGHRFMHERLGLTPLIDLRFRLGQGTGAAVCIELLYLSTRILADIKTFEEVGINNAQ